MVDLKVLTTDGCRSIKGNRNIRIKRNGEVLLLKQLFVPFKDQLLDPISEIIADNAVCNVDDPLAWELRPLSLLACGP